MTSQLYHNIGQQFTEQYGTTVSQMFGKPCLKTGGKAFAAFFNEEMVFKLGQQNISQLLKQYPGSINWDPSGKKRPMKDWIQIPASFDNNWAELAKQALEYVQENK